MPEPVRRTAGPCREKAGRRSAGALARKQLGNGEAFRKLKEMIKAQGGDESALEDFSRLPQGLFSKRGFFFPEGFLTHMDTRLSARPPLSWERPREKRRRC